LILLFLFPGLRGHAQTDTLGITLGINSQTTKMEDFLSKLPIREDPRITDLLVRHTQINQHKNGAEGYRLEIFFSSDNKAREKAMRIVSEFNQLFPDIPGYLLFQTPNFKVRVGDFRNKSEALKAKSLIVSKYPNAFIVKDIIRFPNLDPGRKEQTEESEQQ
jgi:hypothetical protein